MTAAMMMTIGAMATIETVARPFNVENLCDSATVELASQTHSTNTSRRMTSITRKIEHPPLASIVMSSSRSFIDGDFAITWCL